MMEAFQPSDTAFVDFQGAFNFNFDHRFLETTYFFYGAEVGQTLISLQ